MGLASEYVDDGSSFFAVDPLSINPDSLADFALFERYPAKNGSYRFRCLLMDTRSVERSRLMEMIRKWDTVYIHKREAGHYREYVRENLEFILNHEDIQVERKTDALMDLSLNVVEESFAMNFSQRADIEKVIANVQVLLTRAMGFLSSIESLKGVAKLAGHDYETHTHSIKVGWFMATFINSNRDLFDNPGREDLKDLLVEASVAGFLHDLGKVKIPRNIINKPGRLDNLEMMIMQAHPSYSASILFDSPLSHTALQAVVYHHENEDSSGYPCGLSGEEIPLMAKICHMADVFDALTSQRPYKPAKSPFDALKIMAGENPYRDALKKFEAEARENKKPPVTATVRDDYEQKLKRLREREILEAEADKRVRARIQLRDKGMAHCFDPALLRRFILTLNQSKSFDLSALV